MFLNQYNNVQNTVKFYWNYSVLSEVTGMQRSNITTVCSQFCHLLFTHSYFFSKWFIMEYMRKILVWLNSGIKHYKCIYIQIVFSILHSDQKC